MRHAGFVLHNKHQSLIEPRRANHFDDGELPPPLPIKKRHSKTYIIYIVGFWYRIGMLLCI